MTSSTAKLAQGTTLYIAGTNGTPITVTAATKASPVAVTGTHALANGDIVTFPAAGLTGMPEIGGRVGIVLSVSTTVSFTVNIDGSGFAAAATGGTVTPKTWTKISNVKDFNALEGSVSEIDVSNLDSLAKEFKPGLEDFGGLTGTVDLDPADAGHIAAMTAKSASTVTHFRLTYPTASVKRAFEGFMKKFGEQVSVDGVIKSAIEIRATGRVSRTEITN